MYDIIGDIHGHANELVELLEIMGYAERNGCYSHPQRTAVFVGDYIDRGPAIRDVLTIVRNMVAEETAFAVMGNHEFNALAYATPDPNEPGQFLRPHDSRNNTQHAATLEQLSDGELSTALDWFRSLPIALDLESIRTVHACWDTATISNLQRSLDEYGGFSAEFLQQATKPGTVVFNDLERVLKGPEAKLPDGLTVTDKEGQVRKRVRIRWFDEWSNQTMRSFALPTHEAVPDVPFPQTPNPAPYSAGEPPVFFGHYWLPPQPPAPLAANVACLDYSVAKRGFLCGYRFNGESRLSVDNFVRSGASIT